MNLGNIITIYLKELKDSLRDRRTLISTIVIPTLVIPLLFFGGVTIGAKSIKKARSEVPSIMILGGEDSPEVVRQLKSHVKLRIVPAALDWKQQIGDKQLRAAVEIPMGFDAGLKNSAPQAVKIYNYEGEVRSGFAAAELERFFRDLRERTIAGRLAERGLTVDLVKPLETRRQNVAPPEKVGGNLIGGFLPYLIIILCFTGAMYPAMDLTAGEKERGTMETLLCSPVARVDIVLGKFLMVLTGSLSSMALSLASMAGTAMIGGSLLSSPAGKMDAGAQAMTSGMPMIDPAGVLGMLVMVFPVAVLFSAVLFTVALFAKSNKEAQSYIAPMMFVIIIPAVIGMLPGIELATKTALVPILNISLVSKEMLSGIWNWHYIGLIFASSSVYAAVALGLAVRMFNREDVIFRS